MVLPLADLLGNWTGGGGPLYRALAGRIAELVATGELRPGEALPPERRLATTLSVSRSTVVGAYDELRSRGIVERHQGRGTRISPARTASPHHRLAVGPANDVFRALLDRPDGVVDLSSATAVESSPVVREEVARLTENAGAVLDSPGYFPAGYPPLRERVADLLTREGVRTGVEHVLLTTGGQQALSLLAGLFIRPGDAVITEEVTYAGALDAFRTAGARLFGAPLDGDGVNPDALDALVERVRPALVYLIPTFQNPTGTVLTAARRRKIVDLAARHRVPVVADGVLARLAFGDDPLPPPLTAFDTSGLVITVDSLSKVAWGGLRVGWVRADPSIVARLARMKAVADLGSPPLMQLLGVRILDRLEEAAAERRRLLGAGREVLLGGLAGSLPDWTCEPPAGGGVVWAQLPYGDSRSFAQLAQRHGVLVATGPSFSPTESHRDFVRLPILPPSLMAEGVTRLAAAWTRYRPDAEPPFTPSPPLG